MSVAGDESAGRVSFEWVESLDRVSLSVVGVAIVALATRLVSLGTRVAGYSEGRLGSRILEYHATGDWAVAAGGSPLLVHVDRWLFAVTGPSDFVARLPVAVLGALLPLCALLFRDRLRNGAVVGVAVVLAASPALLFHSRMLLPIVPMAAFSLATAGFALRLLDREEPLYALPLAVSVALALGAAPAAILVLGGAILSAWLTAAPSSGRLRPVLQEKSDEWRRPVVASAVLFLVLVTFLFAPRGSVAGGTGLWASLTQPWAVPGVVLEATVGTGALTVEGWVTGPIIVDAPIAELGRSARTVILGAQGVSVLAVVGVLSVVLGKDGADGTTLVRFATLWAVLLFGGTALTVGSASIGPFVPAMVVLSVPAGVGLSVLVSRAVEATRRDAVSTAAVLSLVLGAVMLQGAAVTVDGVYRDPAADQYRLGPSAPGDERLGAVLDVAVVAVQDARDDPAVLYYRSRNDSGDLAVTPGSGTEVSGATTTGNATTDGSPGHPLPWYLGTADATVEETTDTGRVATELPAVVVAKSMAFDALEPHLAGYVAFPVSLPRMDQPVVIFIRTDRLPSDRWRGSLSAAPAGS
jgi:uncharacterized protein (TIGR03663 family)